MNFNAVNSFIGTDGLNFSSIPMRRHPIKHLIGLMN